MIIKQQDISEFESALEAIVNLGEPPNNHYGAFYAGHENDVLANEWLANNPQVFMAGARLQEYVGSHELEVYRRLVKDGLILGMERPAFRKYTGEWFAADYRGEEGFYSYDLKSLDAIAHMEDAFEDYDDQLDGAIEHMGDPYEILKKAKRYVDNPAIDPVSFVSPKLWTPDSQKKEKQILQSVATPLLEAIRNEKIELGSLHWREFEAIVEEMLRQAGMEVHAVRQSPQGGRDIIARTQLVPGETLTIAIEVKHREVIDRPELEKALYQNSNFPALMLVTSGRFTAGVIDEASKPENKMRLFLKDGVAISDMIKTCSW